MTETLTAKEILRREDWVVGPVKHAEAVRFLRSMHYARGAANTSTIRHGLYRAEDYPMLGWVFGVAMWAPPMRSVAEALIRDGESWLGVLTLSRFACSPDAPKNAASYLLGASMRLINRDRWPVLLTYADTGQGHTGAIYRATNWVDEGLSTTGDVWVGPAGEQRGRKRGQRTLTRAEMEALGFRQMPAAPKRRFTHRVRG